MNPAARQSFPRRPDSANSRTENTPLSNSTEAVIQAALPTGRAEAVKRKVRVRMALDNRFLQTAMLNVLSGRSDIEVLNAASTEVFVQRCWWSRGPTC
jgi:hypothetical protein